ncbi:MAG: hypothetical protein WBO34_12790 [Gammaproteobacteria bacterium]
MCYAGIHQGGLFSYRNHESRIHKKHTMRQLRERQHVESGLTERCVVIYAVTGLPSIAPERLPHASLLEIFDPQ